MTILSLFAISLLSACGIRGPLKTPPPIFSGDGKVDSTPVPTGNADDNQNYDSLEDIEDDLLESN